MSDLPPLSPDQEAVLNAIKIHMDSAEWMLTVGGYAGTGKTTIIKHLLNWMSEKRRDVRPVFVSFTGKAVAVLRSKGIPAQTIHSLIYDPIQSDDGEVLFVRKEKHEIPYNMVINDEASMTGQDLFDDLRHLIPGKALFVGDHGQLPPVAGGRTRKTFNLMADPDVKLEKIHRQAEDSDIIRLAHLLRQNRTPPGISTDQIHVAKFGAPTANELADRYVAGELDQIIVASNRTRVMLNEKVRERLGHGKKDLPAVGERVVILNNNKEHGLYNGMICRCVEAKKTSQNYFEMTVDTGDYKVGPLTYLTPDLFATKPMPYDSNVHWHGLMRATFGHALTCHKSQGSEWPRVGVLAEPLYGTSPGRWSYTAATRASGYLDYRCPVLDSRTKI